jgi:hypothetical protein
MRTYKRPIEPVLIQGLQVRAGDSIRPPIKRAKRGRPKVARIRANYSTQKRISAQCVFKVGTIEGFALISL